MENYLAFDLLRCDGMDLLEKYSNLLNQDHFNTFLGLLDTEDTLTIESISFGSDVYYYLNLIIGVLTNYKDRMTSDDQEIFEDICSKLLSISKLSNYIIGQLITYNELPYMIMEIDYDDLSLLLGDGFEVELWVEVDDITKY